MDTKEVYPSGTGHQTAPSLKPLSGFKVFLYRVFFLIPVIGWIGLVVCALSSKNYSRRALARSYFWELLFIVLILTICCVGLKMDMAGLKQAISTYSFGLVRLPEVTEKPAAAAIPTATIPTATVTAEATAITPVTADSSKEEILEVQQMLYDLDLLSAKPDGVYGKKTISAVKAFQTYMNENADASLTVTGDCDVDTLRLLKECSVSGLPEAEEPEAAPTKTAKPEATEKSSGGVTPSFKAAMDSYEEFFDSYISFMKKYAKSSNPLSMAADLADYMSKYADFMEKLEAIDEDSLSEADAAYYAKVYARILKKLTEIE